MIATLSERQTCNVIRELENLPADMPQDEIVERMPEYASRLFAHVANYGVRYDQRCTVRGTLADFGFTLVPNPLEDKRELLVQGISLLRPVHITTEAADLPALILNAPVRSAVESGWPSVAAEFQRIMPAQLLEKIESVGGKVAFGPRPRTELEAATGAMDETAFTLWCIQNGMRVPDQARMNQKIAEERANRNRTEARERDWAARHGNEEQDRSWNIREF